MEKPKMVRKPREVMEPIWVLTHSRSRRTQNVLRGIWGERFMLDYRQEYHSDWTGVWIVDLRTAQVLESTMNLREKVYLTRKIWRRRRFMLAVIEHHARYRLYLELKAKWDKWHEKQSKPVRRLSRAEHLLEQWKRKRKLAETKVRFYEKEIKKRKRHLDKRRDRGDGAGEDAGDEG